MTKKQKFANLLLCKAPSKKKVNMVTSVMEVMEWSLNNFPNINMWNLFVLMVATLKNMNMVETATRTIFLKLVLNHFSAYGGNAV